MSRKGYVVWTVVGMGLVMAIGGCKPSADLKLNFSPDQTARYKSVSEVVKDFRFEQPNLGKLREEQTKTAVEMIFTQAVQSVDDQGNAVAKITIDGLKVNIINKNEHRFAFDSTNEADMNNPMAKLIGQSYTIQIAPDGKIKVLEAKKAAAAVPSGYENKVASSLLEEQNIIQRHEAAAIPAQTGPFNTGDTWSMTVASPPGLLAPKSFEKVYTLTAINSVGGHRVATVNMKAGEAGEPAQGALGGGMGMFAKMFDNEDTYTGSMKLDVETGTLLSVDETLTSTYLAQEMPENADAAKGPDTLTMQFTHKLGLEKLD